VRSNWLTVVLAGVVLLAGTQGLPARDDEGKAEVIALYRRAEALEKAGKGKEAAEVYEQAVAKARGAFGATDTTTAALMNNLAELYREMGAYAKAGPLARRCLQILEAKLGKDHPDVATALNNLALLYYATGKYAKAEPLYRRSLGIWEAKLGKDHPHVAMSLNNLASVHQAMGQYAKAEPLYRRCLEICETKLGKDHPEVATSLNNLAILHKDMGQYAKAEALYQRSLEIRETKLGKDHPEVATALNNLAHLYHEMGQYAKAEPLFRRGLQIKEANLGKDHPSLATSLQGLAVLYQAMGQYAKAEPLFRRSLQLWEAKLGKDHPDVATALNNLASLYQDMGQYAKAEPLYQRSLQIYEAKLGKDHPDVANALNGLALLCAATGEPGKAASLTDRARRGARHHLAAVLPALSDADKTAFFQNTTARSTLEGALSLGLAQRGDADLVAQSATWLLNGKAVDQESLAASVLLSRQSGDPAVGKLASRLLRVRQSLARLTLSVPQAGQEKQRLEQIAELTRQEQDLGKQLRQSGSRAALPQWVELAAVRQALPADAVLIDIAHFRRFDLKSRGGEKKWQEAHYAAWLTPKAGPVRLIDLGPAEKIDEAVKRFRAAMQQATRRVKADGEEAAEKALREHLDALSALVLKPLLPHISASKKWLVSPDGNLWLLPWEALTLPDGKFAVEKHLVSYLTSGRDLLPPPEAKVKVSAPLVLADPDYDLDAGEARRSAKRLLGAAEEEATRALPGAFRLGTVRRLKGTAAEARAITPSLKAYAGVAPRVHTEAEALEGVVKAARSPRVLVLSTHGFFLPDQEVPRDDKGKPRAEKRWENPLLRCGLLLAGCNNAARATEGDDGVLTGLEVVGTDLRGTELVVLSACETGLGDVQSGEGVAGLRQAFQLAGARAVVSTLWQVPDKQSARLMALFFQNLSGGKMSRAEALRAAKVKLIEERRDDFAAAHPFFWAAFTLTGEP
jgi:CHAT domain-containing protein/Tfp pilus assembly protein PilF